jgi:hypothetical protein
VRRTAAIILALGVLSTACGAPEPSASPLELFFPRYRPLDAVPSALITADLRLHDGCLWLSADDVDYLVLWPWDSQLAAVSGAVAVSVNGALIPAGSRVRVGGGEYRDAPSHPPWATAWIEEELLGHAIPAACRTGTYWLATEVSRI